MSEQDTLQIIRSELTRIQADSTAKLYKYAAIMGAERTLLEHFGNAQKLEEAGLAKQLEFLLDQCADRQVVRNKLALEWFLLRIDTAVPTPELALVVSRIDLVPDFSLTTSS